MGFWGARSSSIHKVFCPFLLFLRRGRIDQFFLKFLPAGSTLMVFGNKSLDTLPLMVICEEFCEMTGGRT